jgi:hypothetical protein
MPGKYNPFRPDKIAPPGLFCGRMEEIAFIEGCLRQTKNGNPKHFIITGERGIGKSSLVLLEQLTALGKIPSVTGSGKSYNFLVVNVSLRKEDNFLSIIERIASALKKQVEKDNALAGIVLKSLNFLSRIEAAGIKYNRDSVVSTEEEGLSSLQDDFETALLKMADSRDGILILIDEADGPPSSANLGLLVKLLTEELAMREVDKVCVGLAGLPGLITKLRESHESSLRLFHIMNLKPLEPDERMQVLQHGIDEANRKNDKPVVLDTKAAEMISMFSEGYPHFLQEFAYCAFEADINYLIDREDFLASLFDENGAFDQLGAKYFDKPYAAPGSDDYRKVLVAMSEFDDQWVSRSEIISASGLKPVTIDNALRALKAKDIIIPDETRAGYYRLPTRSFAAWINLRKKAGVE